MYGQDSKLMLEGTELRQEDIGAIILPGHIFKRYIFEHKPVPGSSPDNPIKFKVDLIERTDDGLVLGYYPLPSIGMDSLLCGDEEGLEYYCVKCAEMQHNINEAADGFNIVYVEYRP